MSVQISSYSRIVRLGRESDRRMTPLHPLHRCRRAISQVEASMQQGTLVAGYLTRLAHHLMMPFTNSRFSVP